MNRDKINDTLDRESEFDIAGFDKKAIFCYLNKAQHKTYSPKAVVIAHGLTGHPNEYLHLTARDYFNTHGYDVYRLAFYRDGDQYRDLFDCTVQHHAHDLRSVIAHIRKDHEKIYVCGHSYGGLTLLMANPDINAGSFWDSSFTPYKEFWNQDAQYIPEMDCYKVRWASGNLIGTPMVEEAKNIDQKAGEMAKSFRAPAQVILAEKNSWNPERTALFESLRGEKDFQDIKGATHCFTDGRVVDELVEITHAWFERF